MEQMGQVGQEGHVCIHRERVNQRMIGLVLLREQDTRRVRSLAWRA
jgi:hypothetical protein